LRQRDTSREKEQKLQEFIYQHPAGAQHGGDASRATHLLIIARSLESPRQAGRWGSRTRSRLPGLSARMILAQVDREPLPEEWGRAITFSHEIRWAKHPRLIEAHEQLVLGPETCWIGDCMRRDPAKCDAYESYVEGCGEAAGCAAVSFERLWLASQPLMSSSPAGSAAGLAQAARCRSSRPPPSPPPVRGIEWQAVGNRQLAVARRGRRAV
jgi:hypothetical protein